ncbi:ATP-binding protein [Sphingomonas bacterium]|uniref:ATP-binding protein n=1 Tax=Sphingomonas bacterium TaxID=1895847 RepID=UPI0015762105|nr:ATP-binding protein [Sphingomonas bacterium]
MDAVRNPFAPGAGNPPPELAGRQVLLDQADVALQRVKQGRASQSLILVGLRGVGKTVLLNRIKVMAEGYGYRTAFVEAHEGKSLAELLLPSIRNLLFSFSMMDAAKEKARRALRVLRGFLSAIKLNLGQLDLEIGLDAERGVADSGDLESDLPNLLQVVAEAARAASSSVALLIDELQYFDEREFSALIMSMHKINQAGLPFVMFGAGLPQVMALAGESKSYAERLFRYPPIGPLDPEDAAAALRSPIESEDAAITEPALARILELTGAYPYFLQQWGHDCWNTAADPLIELDDVDRASLVAIRTLDEGFFKVRFDRCTPSERRYMRALAELGPGAHRSGDIAQMLGLKTTSVGPTRGKLIKKGMIYAPAHAETEFTVPLFDEYMRRAMPDL